MAALPVPADPSLRAVLYDVPARVAAATTALVLDNHVLANDGADSRASSTPFTWIAPLLARFAHLESLSLVACALTTLDGFPLLPRLARLSVADNPWLNGHLAVVARQCPGLRALDASNTTVESVEEVAVLTALPHLATLSLVSCPVAATLGTSPTYRAAIFAAVPALDVLDGLDRDGRECDDEDDEDDDEETEGEEDNVPSSPPLNPGYYASTAGKGLRRAQKGGRSKGPPTAGKGVSRKFFGKGVPMKGGLRVGNGAAHDDDDDEEEEEEENVWSDHDDDDDDDDEADAPRRVVMIEIDDSEDEHENGDYQHDRRVEETDDEEEDEDEVESSFQDGPVPLDPLPPRPTAVMHEVVVLGESDMDEESDYDDEDEDEDSLIGILEVTRPPHPTHETVDDLDDDEDDGYDEDDEPSEWSAAPAPPPAAPVPVVVELQDDDDEVEDEYDDDEESQFDELPAQPAPTAAPVDVNSDEYNDEYGFEGDAAAPNLAELYGDAFTNGLDVSFSHNQLDEGDDAFDLADDEDRDDDGVVSVTGKRAFDLSSDGLADQVHKRARHGP